MNVKSKNADLLVKASYRHILQIALPICLALLVPQLNFVINNVFLSRLGETALGTAGITGVCYLVFALVGNGLNSGLQGLIARRAGEQRPEEIGKLFGQSVWIALLYALASILITYTLAPFILTSALQSPAVEESAISFLKLRVWGLPFLYLFQLGTAMLVGTNNSRYLKYAFVLQALINVFLDYVLIFGKLGFPEMGFNGAALASVIAEIFAALLIFAIIRYKNFHTRFSLFTNFNFVRSRAGLIFRQSFPLVLQYLLSILAWLLFYILIEHVGEHALAISSTMRNVFGVFGVFAWGFASTSNAMVSNIIGQGKKEDVVRLVTKITLLSTGLTAGFCILLNLFPSEFLMVFGQTNGFVRDGIPVLRVVTVGVLCMSVATVWLNAVTGTGNTFMNLMIEIIAIVLYTLFIWFVIREWRLSLAWAWSAELLYWLILFLLSFFYLQTNDWKKKQI